MAIEYITVDEVNCIAHSKRPEHLLGHQTRMFYVVASPCFSRMPCSDGLIPEEASFDEQPFRKPLFLFNDVLPTEAITLRCDSSASVNTANSPFQFGIPVAPKKTCLDKLCDTIGFEYRFKGGTLFPYFGEVHTSFSRR